MNERQRRIGQRPSSPVIVPVHDDERERMHNARVRLMTSRPRWPGIRRGDRTVAR